MSRKNAFVFICLTTFLLLLACTIEASDVNRLIVYMIETLKMSPERANIVMEGILDAINIDGATATPLEMVALLEAESAGKNIFGDGGEAIGYFQLHKEAIWYVWAYFPHLKPESFKGRSIKELLYFPYLQARIATIYFSMMKERYGNNAPKMYNGGSQAYQVRYQRILTKVMHITGLGVQEVVGKLDNKADG